MHKQGPRIHGVQGGRAAAAPPDFENPKKLSHKNAIKPNFSEKRGKIRLLAPPDFWSSRGPCGCDISQVCGCMQCALNISFKIRFVLILSATYIFLYLENIGLFSPRP